MRLFLFGFFLLQLLLLPAQPGQKNFIDRNYLIQQRVTHGLVFDIIQDRIGYMWFATEHGLVRFDGQNLKEYRYDPLDENSLSGDVVTCLAEDILGNLWVGTMHAGLNYFDKKHNRFIRFPFEKDTCTISANKINKILIDSNNTVWVSTEGGGLNKIKPNTNCISRVQKPKINSDFTDALFESRDRSIWMGSYFGLNKKKAADDDFDSIPLLSKEGKRLQIIKSIEEDHEGNFWLGTRNQGLFKLNRSIGTIDRISLPSSPESNTRIDNIWDLMFDSTGVMWVCTDGGLSIIEKNKPTHIITSLDQNGLRRVLSISKSRDGVIWLGTNSGVVVLAPRLKRFDLIRVRVQPEDYLIKRGVSYIIMGRDGQIWIGTTRGLYTYLPQIKSFSNAYLQKYPALDALSNSIIAAFYEDHVGNFWISTVTGFNAGFEVFRYEKEKNKLIRCSFSCESFRSHITQHIEEDSQNNLWFANGLGLIRYHPNTNLYHRFNSTFHDSSGPAGNYINRLFISSDQQLWLGTNDAGLNRYDLEKNLFTNFKYKAGDTNALSDKRVFQILEDYNHKLWIATSGGLNYFDPVRNSFKHYFKKNGLLEDYINGIIQDRHGMMWLTTPKSLVHFNPQTEEFINFDKSDGLDQSEFWDRAAFKDNQNQIYFGGDDGLVVFDPDQIRLNSYLPNVVIHEINVLHKSILHDQNQSPPISKTTQPDIHLRDISTIPKINLKHWQNIISFGFAALNFIRPDKVQYAIRMEGFESDWQYIDHRREATYTNLNPGKYTFKVKATNNDGIWNDRGASLQLAVLAPWWNSTVSWIIYLMLFAGGIWYIYRFQFNRHLQEVETVRLREMDAFKSRFYTNITHEFRTPLTVILGPVENALKNKTDLKNNALLPIQRNAKRLLQLINQLLHLSKLESGNIEFNYIQKDVVAFMRYLTESFQSYATSQEIELLFQSALSNLVMDIDEEKLTEITVNIISNALKYTSPGGSVRIRLNYGPEHNSDKSQNLIIEITDTGQGIAQEKLNKIFDRFYSLNPNEQEGIGIGLALAKEWTENLGGKLSVQSELGMGSTFTILIPIHHDAVFSNDPHFNAITSAPVLELHETWNESKEQINENLPLVLIAEDNIDVHRFISECISDRYRVLHAINGSDGINQAILHTPDIILSDVMMPGIDGMELTQTLKSDARTSHIPIILITARGDDDSRIEGLKHKADLYIIKPFNQEELLLIMSNLLDMRRKLHIWFSHHVWNDEHRLNEINIKPIEHEYIRKLRACCEKHLNDTSFSIEDLCQAMGMSHSQVHRKMVALTGESVQKFLKKIRLEKGKELLKTSEMTIAEIAYETGFSEPAYFTKVFTKEFGISPSVWKKQVKD